MCVMRACVCVHACVRVHACVCVPMCVYVYVCVYRVIPSFLIVFLLSLAAGTLATAMRPNLPAPSSGRSPPPATSVVGGEGGRRIHTCRLFLLPHSLDF